MIANVEWDFIALPYKKRHIYTNASDGSLLSHSAICNGATRTHSFTKSAWTHSCCYFYFCSALRESLLSKGIAAHPSGFLAGCFQLCTGKASSSPSARAPEPGQSKQDLIKCLVKKLCMVERKFSASLGCLGRKSHSVYPLESCRFICAMSICCEKNGLSIFWSWSCLCLRRECFDLFFFLQRGEALPLMSQIQR